MIDMAQAENLGDPLRDSSIWSVLQTFLHAITLALAPMLVIAVIIVGLLFILARGNGSELANAKKYAMYVLLAIVIVFGLTAVLNIIVNLLYKLHNAL